MLQLLRWADIAESQLKSFMARFGDQLTAPLQGRNDGAAFSAEKQEAMKEKMLSEWIGFIRGNYKQPNPPEFKELKGPFRTMEVIVGPELHFRYTLQPDPVELNKALLAVGLCSAGNMEAAQSAVKRSRGKHVHDKSNKIEALVAPLSMEFEYGSGCGDLQQGDFIFLFPGGAI